MSKPDENGWGATFHRHFGSNEIHRDGGPECNQPGKPRPVYVFDPDYLAEHDERVRREAREGYVARRDVYDDEQMRKYVEAHMAQIIERVRREAAAEQREKDAQIARSIAMAVWAQDSYTWDDESEMSPDERAAADLGAQRAVRAIREQRTDA